MKLIIAIIQPHCIDPVKRELNEAGVTRLTVMDCQGFGRQEGKSGVLGTEEAKLNPRHKLQLQIAVNEDFVEPTVQAIVRGALNRVRFDAFSMLCCQYARQSLLDRFTCDSAFFYS